MPRKLKGLKSAGATICYNCHKENGFKNSVSHLPVVEGKCTMCHSPHASDFEYELIAQIGELCYSCHADEKKKI